MPPTPEHLELGRMIRTTRRAQGLTQGQLALRARTGPHAVGAVERGTLTLPLATLLRIAAVLGLSCQIQLAPALPV